MPKYIFWMLSLLLFLSACQQVEELSQNADVSQIEEAQFYSDLQSTVARVQLPIIALGLVNLAFGWKLGRVGLMMNGFAFGGLMIYTWLKSNAVTEDENLMLTGAVVGGIGIGILTFFLYNLMALLIGGAIGTTILGSAWLQVLDNVPPQALVFISSFVSALVMFVVFRLFLVAFSAVIGAALLMLAIPFEALWGIPVTALGILMQTGIAWWIKDDIFQSLRGDLRAATGAAFGEVLGPFGTLRERQRESTPAKAHPQAAPPPRPSYPQQAAPPPPRPVQQAAPPPRPSYPQQVAPAYSPPRPANSAVTQPNLKAISPQSWILSLSDGRMIPLSGSQVTLGRANDNTVVVIDPEVSSYHLAIYIQPDSIIIFDNNSTNGTLVNGEYLQGSRPFTPYDIVQIGAITLRLIPSQT